MRDETSTAPKRKPPNRTRAAQTLLRTTEADKAALHKLADIYGVTVSDLVPLMIRKLAKLEGLTLFSEP